MSKLDRIRQIISDRIQLQDAYKRVFDSDDGQIVLRHLMREGFVTKSTFVARDPHETALNEGSRRIVLSVLRQVHRDPKKLQQQLEQAHYEDV